MPTRKPPKELDPEYLERAFIQVNVRVPLGLRARVDEYLTYMSKAEHRRPPASKEWPKSLSGVVIAALDEFLDSHPLTGKRGPRDKYVPADYIKIGRTQSKIKPKQPTE